MNYRISAETSRTYVHRAVKPEIVIIVRPLEGGGGTARVEVFESVKVSVLGRDGAREVEVALEEQILEAGEGGESRRKRAADLVVHDTEKLLQPRELTELRRMGAADRVEAQVECKEIPEIGQLGGERANETHVAEADLLECTEPSNLSG